MQTRVPSQLRQKLLDIYPGVKNPALQPCTAALFSELPSLGSAQFTINAFRQAVEALDGVAGFSVSKKTLDQFEDLTIGPIPCSVLRNERSQDRPTVVFIGGSGFCAHLPQVYRSLMGKVSEHAPLNIVLPWHSLSPEVKIEAMLLEVCQFLLALLEGKSQLGFSGNFILMGYSAGANLAWQSLSALTDSHPHLASKVSKLILLSPWVDVSLKTCASGLYPQQDLDQMCLLSTLEQLQDWALSHGLTGVESSISPVFDDPEKWARLPETSVVVGECERLLSDAVLTTYVLQQAQVSTQLTVLNGHSHNYAAHAGLGGDEAIPELLANLVVR